MAAARHKPAPVAKPAPILDASILNAIADAIENAEAADGGSDNEANLEHLLFFRRAQRAKTVLFSHGLWAIADNPTTMREIGAAVIAWEIMEPWEWDATREAWQKVQLPGGKAIDGVQEDTPHVVWSFVADSYPTDSLQRRVWRWVTVMNSLTHEPVILATRTLRDLAGYRSHSPAYDLLQGMRDRGELICVDPGRPGIPAHGLPGEGGKYLPGTMPAEQQEGATGANVPNRQRTERRTPAVRRIRSAKGGRGKGASADVPKPDADAGAPVPGGDISGSAGAAGHAAQDARGQPVAAEVIPESWRNLEEVNRQRADYAWVLHTGGAERREELQKWIVAYPWVEDLLCERAGLNTGPTILDA